MFNLMSNFSGSYQGTDFRFFILIFGEQINESVPPIFDVPEYG